MNKFLGSKTVVVYILCFVCLIFVSNSTAQQKKRISDLEKRITSLEKRVRTLEARLEKALNPAKHMKQTQQTASKAKRSTVKLIKSPIKAKLIKKKLKLAEPGEVDDNLALLITFKNDGAEGIVSFKGDIIFKDIYADSIMSFSAEIDKAIPAGMSNTWFGGVTYDAANKSHRKLLDIDINNLQTLVRPKVIVFSDGTIKTFKQK